MDSFFGAQVGQVSFAEVMAALIPGTSSTSAQTPALCSSSPRSRLQSYEREAAQWSPPGVVDFAHNLFDSSLCCWLLSGGWG